MSNREESVREKGGVQKETEKKSSKPFYKRRWVKVFGLLSLLFSLLFIFGIPLGLKYYAVDWLKKNGADHAAIDKLGWNPFVGKLWLDGVDLSREGKPLMKQAGLDIQFDLKSLIGKDIKISSITYRGLFLELERKEKGGWEIATLSIPAGKKGEGQDDKGKNGEAEAERTVIAESDGEISAAGDNAGDNGEKGSKQGSDTALPWAFLADNIRLKECQVHYKSPILDITAKVDEAGIDNFSTRSESDGGRFFLKGTANDAKLTINLHKVTVAPDLQLSGKVKIDGFNLDDLDTILKKALPHFGGIASLDGDADFILGRAGLDVRYNGGIAVEKADVGSASFRTGAKKLSYNGAVHYAMPQGKPMIVETDGILQADGYALQVPPAGLAMTESLVKVSGKTTVTIGGGGGGGGVIVDTTATLAIDDIGFKMPMLETAAKSLRWQGKVLYDLAHYNLVNTDGRLQLTGISYGMDKLGMAVNNEKFDWQGKILYQGKQKEESNIVQCSGTMQLAPLAFEIGQEGKKSKAAVANISYKGEFHFGQKKEKGSNIAFNGTLSDKSAEIVLEGADIAMEQQEMVLVSKSKMHFGKVLDITSESSLQSGAFALFTANKEKPLVAIQSIQLEGVKGTGGSNISASSLQIEGVTANIAGDMPLQITAPHIAVKDFATPDLQQFTVQSAELDNPRITAEKNRKELFRAAGVSLKKIAADAKGDAAVGSLRLQNVSLLAEENKAATLRLGMARAAEIKWGSKEGFSSRFLGFSNLMANITRDRAGEFDFSHRLFAMKSEEAQAKIAAAKKDVKEKEKAEKGKKRKEAGKKSAEKEKRGKKKGDPLDLPVGIAIGELLIDGQSGVVFQDNSMDLPFTGTLRIDKLRLGAFDSKKAERRTPLELAAKLEKRAPLHIHGNIQPFLKETGIALTIELKNYPLQNLSPYVVQAIGSGIASGQLLYKSGLTLGNNYIAMDNKVVLRQLETKTISKELSDKMSSQLPIPLDAALALLRDKNDTITLKVPIKGDLDSLNIGLADTIITVLGKAVVPALSGYAVYALGPYGALAYVGMKLGEDMMKEGAVPIIFMQGETNLVDEQKKELAKVAEKMQKSEDDMQLCPIVASWEFMSREQIEAAGSTIAVPEQERARLEELGQRRAQMVQEFLVQNYGIDRNRLLLCTTVIKEEKKMLPLVVVQR